MNGVAAEIEARRKKFNSGFRYRKTRDPTERNVYAKPYGNYKFLKPEGVLPPLTSEEKIKLEEYTRGSR